MAGKRSVNASHCGRIRSSAQHFVESPRRPQHNGGDNIGPDAVTVLSGPLSVTTDAFTGGAGPNPFYAFDFTTPYTYEGGDLLFTLNVANSGGLVLDANSVDANGDTVGIVNGAT